MSIEGEIRKLAATAYKRLAASSWVLVVAGKPSPSPTHLAVWKQAKAAYEDCEYWHGYGMAKLLVSPMLRLSDSTVQLCVGINNSSFTHVNVGSHIVFVIVDGQMSTPGGVYQGCHFLSWSTKIARAMCTSSGPSMNFGKASALIKELAGGAAQTTTTVCSECKKAMEILEAELVVDIRKKV